jgi:hypothetical protein
VVRRVGHGDAVEQQILSGAGLRRLELQHLYAGAPALAVAGKVQDQELPYRFAI